MIFLAFALLATACGVSAEEYDIVVEESRNANAAATELENDLSRAESALAKAEKGRAAAEANATTSEADLEAVLSDLDQAQTAVDELREMQIGTSANGSVLFSVMFAGELRCGINGSAAGWSELASNGTATGFDVDFCRAIAAAVLGDADAVEYVPLNPSERFSALQTGQVDVLIRNTTHTLGRTAREFVDFGPTIFYDGMQFMGESSTFGSGEVSAVHGQRVCVLEAPIAQKHLLAIAADFGITVNLVPAPPGEWVSRLTGDQCDVLAADGSFLISIGLQAIDGGAFAAGDLTIFPGVPLTKEPLAPVVLQGDTFWRDAVDWAVYATMLAEEKGIISDNIDSVAWDLETQRLFGVEGDDVFWLGLSPDAFYQVIAQVGNYGEIFERNLGALGFEREGSLNMQWYDGGLLYAPRV